MKIQKILELVNESTQFHFRIQNVIAKSSSYGVDIVIEINNGDWSNGENTDALMLSLWFNGDSLNPRHNEIIGLDPTTWICNDTDDMIDYLENELGKDYEFSADLYMVGYVKIFQFDIDVLLSEYARLVSIIKNLIQKCENFKSFELQELGFITVTYCLSKNCQKKYGYRSL